MFTPIESILGAGIWMPLGRVQFATLDGSHTSQHWAEIFVSHVPGNAKCVQDESLCGLSARHAFFNGVDGSGRDARSAGELTLRPTMSLSCSADPVHCEPLRGVLRVSAIPSILALRGGLSRGRFA